MSMRDIKVGESPEGSQAGKEDTPSGWKRLIDGEIERGQVPARWIINGIFKDATGVNLGII